MKQTQLGLMIGICSLFISACDKFSLEERVIKADEGAWEITLTTRIPNSDAVISKIDQYCLTRDEVANLIDSYRYLPNEQNCDSDMTAYKTEKNVTRQKWRCSHPIIGEYTASIVTGQGTNTFDKFLQLEGQNIVSLYRKQMIKAGFKNPPNSGNIIEIIELGVLKEAEVIQSKCKTMKPQEIRKKNRELSIGTTGSGSSGSEPIKLTDFLGD